MSTIRSGDIQVHGLAQLSRALRQLEGEFPKELRGVNREIAETVADKAQSVAYSIGGVAAHVAPSISARAGQQSASVAFGGARYPMAGGAEFGSIRYRQFKPWRGNSSDAGYFVYPAIRAEAPDIEPRYTEAINDLIERAGLS